MWDVEGLSDDSFQVNNLANPFELNPLQLCEPKLCLQKTYQATSLCVVVVVKIYYFREKYYFDSIHIAIISM